jgi:hypothetical protein
MHDRNETTAVSEVRPEMAVHPETHARLGKVDRATRGDSRDRFDDGAVVHPGGTSAARFHAGTDRDGARARARRDPAFGS